MGLTRRRSTITNYTHRELQVLWHLKKYGPIVKKSGNSSILNKMALDLEMNVGALRYVLGSLETRSIVLRTYKRKKFEKFESQGHNPLLKIELIDPNMSLPAYDPLPLGVVMAKENRELEERVEQLHNNEPSAEAIVDALLNRLSEYQEQVNKLQDIIVQQEEEMARLKKVAAPAKVHISQRLQEALTPDQWRELRNR